MASEVKQVDRAKFLESFYSQGAQPQWSSAKRPLPGRMRYRSLSKPINQLWKVIGQIGVLAQSNHLGRRHC